MVVFQEFRLKFGKMHFLGTEILLFIPNDFSLRWQTHFNANDHLNMSFK